MADDALVSIIMPTWNREALIRVAIQSVAAQTHRAWELIIVDDGSTDATIEIAEQAASEDSRIRLIKLPHGGVAKARNAGVRAAVGDYLAFLDTDNEWTHRHLELSVRWLAAHSANVATHNGLRITEADGSVTYRGAEIGIEALAKRSLIDMNSLVVRRGVALARGGFDESLARWVDYALMLDIAEQGDIAYLPFIGCEYFDGDASDRITRRESVHWQFVAAARHVVRWDELRTTQNDRIRGRVSIVILVYEDFVHTLLGVDRVLQTTADQDVEVILVDNGSHLATSRIVAARYHNHPRVTYRRLSRNYNFATGCNYGFSISSGEYVLLLNHDTIVRDGWLGPLVERLESTDAIGVQPLILNPNGTTQAAGAVFVFDEKVPAQFLARLPREDAFRHDGKGFAAVHGVALLMRSDLFEKLRGFDPIYANGLEDYDLCLRACELTGGRFEVEPRSLVEHTEARTPGRFARSEENKRIFLDRWRGRIPTGDEKKFKDLGLEVAHTRPLPGGHGWLPVLVRPKRTVHVEGFGKIPSLRWAVKIGASGSYRADWWGDTIFSEDLRVALEKLGQEVVVDRYGAFERDTAYLDDVVLTVRGVRPPVVQMGRVNLMWVISRPELVSATEIRSQDLVYAASGPWARRMTAESGVDVRTMLQATNPGRFRPEARSSDLRSDVLFVGGAREAIGGRPLVEMALKSGVDLSLWGPGWDLVAPGNTRGEYLPFSRTPEAYASCNVVLNDHMDPMREHGFVSNRTFDAVASGAAVISDEIDGLELFQGAVRPCGSLEEMEELSADRSWIPDRARFKEISAMIAREHSFDARAAVMLRDVLNLLG
ncbi:glycosyltransferase [Xylanimonas sp. McL0601]|uniref:glycosyltransferase n=1 Tax=Xylanimonas sp. McL0601 TaxID=3414739 RepID=UPI003CE6FF54